jgi:UDP-3-O-[3-hydroxymyristoyl] glucosamine N-acyltransferase
MKVQVAAQKERVHMHNRLYQLEIVTGEVAFVSDHAILGHGSIFHNGARIEAYTIIDSCVTVGVESRVSRHVSVRAGTVIGDHVVIEERSIIAHDVRIGDRTVIGHDTIIGARAIIDSDTVLGPNLMIPHDAQIPTGTYNDQYTVDCLWDECDD